MIVTTDLEDAAPEVVRRLLVQGGQASDPDAAPGAWPAYKGVESSEPDEAITVYGTTGTDSGRTAVDGEVARHFGIQLRVRGSDDDVYKKAEALRRWMERGVYMGKVTIGPTTYLVPAFVAIGQVLELGRDRSPSGRYVCTINAQCAIRAITGA